jgi:hypothetical protein
MDYLENYKLYAWTNEESIESEIKAVMLRFHGLSYVATKNDADELDLEMAEAGILTVYPYYGAWSWMNKKAVMIVDLITKSIYRAFGLSENVPLLSTGRSMGGLSALVYSAYGYKKPAACYAFAPVCDLLYHSAEREDIPRTLLCAFADYNTSFEDALKSCSPIHISDKMPDISYLLLHAKGDPKVNFKHHSAAMFDKMKSKGFDVELLSFESDSHCRMTKLSQFKRVVGFLKDNAGI